MGCWTNFHPDEWSVYDLSQWIIEHPGNPEAFRKSKPNPIANIVQQSQVTLNFPSWHEQSRWDSNKWRFTFVGWWYDTVNFASLDPKLQDPTMAAVLGSAQNGFSGSTEVCGSLGEVANVPSKGHQYNNYRYEDQTDTLGLSLDQDHPHYFSKNMVWTTIALKSPDQLLQRFAWALSQIFVVTTNDINRDQKTEPWAAYHDIFVRNAFGSYRQILKEVSHNPSMGIMLTYLGSKSLARCVEESGAMSFPDENFAIEIMQLFQSACGSFIQMQLVYLTRQAPQFLLTTLATSQPLPEVGLDWNMESDKDNLESGWTPDLYTNYIDPMNI